MCAKQINPKKRGCAWVTFTWHMSSLSEPDYQLVTIFQSWRNDFCLCNLCLKSSWSCLKVWWSLETKTMGHAHCLLDRISEVRGFQRGVVTIGVTRAPVAIINFASIPFENLRVYIGFNKDFPHKKPQINYCNRCAHDHNYWDSPPLTKTPFWKPPKGRRGAEQGEDFRVALPQNEIAPEKQKTKRYKKWFEIREKRSEKRSQTSPQIVSASLAA